MKVEWIPLCAAAALCACGSLAAPDNLCWERTELWCQRIFGCLSPQQLSSPQISLKTGTSGGSCQSIRGVECQRLARAWELGHIRHDEALARTCLEDARRALTCGVIRHEHGLAIAGDQEEYQAWLTITENAPDSACARATACAGGGDLPACLPGAP